MHQLRFDNAQNHLDGPPNIRNIQNINSELHNIHTIHIRSKIFIACDFCWKPLAMLLIMRNEH